LPLQPTDFSEHRWGRLTRAAEGYWAFVPNPLPPRLDWDWELAATLSEADRALGELAGAARRLPNPHLLIGPFIRREAVLSSRIEGTQASLSDLFYFEAAALPPDRKPASDVREVANYVSAMEHGIKRLKEFPLSLRLLRELHGRLMEGVRGKHLTPGEFRRSPNWIGPPGCNLAEATYVPPSVPEMLEALGAFEKFLHARSSLPPLVRLALVHYQFEAIHPFLDGNGRIGRLLITLLLCHDGVLSDPLLYLSVYFERLRDDYYRLLLGVSQRGAWRDWIAFFLAGVADQARDALWRASQLHQLWDSYRATLARARASALLLRLIDELFAAPVITIPRAAKVLGVTPRAARLNIDKLTRAGILEEVTGRQRYQVFTAREILKAIEQPKPTTG
jgi:Fic family protein